MIASEVHPKTEKTREKNELGETITNNKGKDETNLRDLKLTAALSKKSQTPGESAPIQEYIRLSDKQTDKFDSKLYRNDGDGSESGRSIATKGKSSFMKLSINDKIFAVGDQLFADDEKCLEVFQCFSESTGKLFTVKFINVASSDAAA